MWTVSTLSWSAIFAAAASESEDEVVQWLCGLSDAPAGEGDATRTRLARQFVAAIDAQLRTVRRMVLAHHHHHSQPPPQPQPPLAQPTPPPPPSYESAFPSIQQANTRGRRITPTAVAAAATTPASFHAAPVAPFVPVAEAARSLLADAPVASARSGATASSAAVVSVVSSVDDDRGSGATLSRALSSSSIGVGATGSGEPLTLAGAAPTLDAGEQALIGRLARVYGALLLYGVSSDLLHDCRAVVSVLRAWTPPLARACTAVPSDVDGQPAPLWTVALLRGGERCAVFSSAVLRHVQRVLLALNGSALAALAASSVLRKREPGLCDALQRSLERAQRRVERVAPLAAASRSRQPQAAAHISVDDANRNRFRERAEQATYNNRERQRDEFLQIQRAWLDSVPSGDDAALLELRQLAVDELASSVRQFLSRTDSLNLPWLATMLREQLLAAAVADPLDEQDEAIKAMASAEKLRKLRGRIDGARGATGASSSSPSGGALRGKQQASPQGAQHRARMPAATAAVVAARQRSFAALFVGASAPTRCTAALAFVYEFAEAALQQGGHLHTVLVAVLVSSLHEMLRASGADGAATRLDLAALRAGLARQTQQLCAVARFLGFVQALPFFNVYAQGSDAPLDGTEAADAMAWPVQPAAFIAAAQRSGALVLTLPWACALLAAWRCERALSHSRLVRQTVAALRAVAPSDVLLSSDLATPLTLPRIYALHTLTSTLAALGELPELPRVRPPRALRESLRASSQFDDGDAEAHATPEKAPLSVSSSTSSSATAPDDFGELLDDDFVRLCFEPLDALVLAAVQLRDDGAGGAGGSGAARPTKKITLTSPHPTPAAVAERAAGGGASQPEREQEQLRRWFAWQHPHIATLAESVSSGVARATLAFMSEQNAVLQGEIERALAKLLARLAIGDVVARAQFERLAREPLAAVLPGDVGELQTRVGEWARGAIAAFVDERVRAALPLLLPATLTGAVSEAAVAHTRGLALALVQQSGAQRAVHIAVNAVSGELSKIARACRNDTLRWSEAAPTTEAAIQCLCAATVLFEPSDGECVRVLRSTTSANPLLCERIRALARVDDGGERSGVALRCVAAAIDALLFTLEAEPRLRERGQWQPLLPRVTLALGEAAAHAIEHASGAQQATALCALVRHASAALAAVDARVVHNVAHIVLDRRHRQRRAAPLDACVRQMLSDMVHVDRSLDADALRRIAAVHDDGGVVNDKAMP